MSFEVGIIGKIISGNHEGWYILIKKYSDQSESFHILISNTANFGKIGLYSEIEEGFDIFCQNGDSVLAQIEYEGWNIDWKVNLDS